MSVILQGGVRVRLKVWLPIVVGASVLALILVIGGKRLLDSEDVTPSMHAEALAKGAIVVEAIGKYRNESQPRSRAIESSISRVNSVEPFKYFGANNSPTVDMSMP